MNKKAFSLIEILVVITIIGIIISFASASYTQSQKKARDSKRKTDLKAVQEALERYHNANGRYPQGLAAFGYIRCADGSSVYWGNPFTCSSVTYIQNLPKDPKDQSVQYGYYYYSVTPFQDYKISARLENSNDTEYCNTALGNCDTVQHKLPCHPQNNRNYCVINP